MKYITTIDSQEYTIDVNDDGHVQIDGQTFNVDFCGLPDTSLYSLIMNGQSYDIDIDRNEAQFNVTVKSVFYEVKVEDERTRRLAGLRGGLSEAVGEIFIKAPMPGVVAAIPVAEGQSVAKNDVVIILESMKMQNEFKAPRDGVINRIRVQKGDRVEQNAIMLSIA